MSSVLLIYPFVRRSIDRSRFRFPPLGVAYVAAAVRDAGHEVRVLDCTFLRRDQALRMALAANAEVVGISCMATMLDDCLWFAARLRGRCRLLVAGGPLPTCEPETFLPYFDAVVRGEGEATMVELLAAHEAGADLGAVPGVVTRGTARTGGSGLAAPAPAPPRPFAPDLDRLAFPARDLLPNAAYIRHGRRHYGFSVTTVMSTRGCPSTASSAATSSSAQSYRERSPASVVDEVEQALALGYERISFADDVFTLERDRVVAICDEILRRGLRFTGSAWPASTPSTSDRPGDADGPAARASSSASSRGRRGPAAHEQAHHRGRGARDAVEAAHRAGLEVGAFFILFYPGETDDTVLETLRFAGSLPLDYLGLIDAVPTPRDGLARAPRRPRRARRAASTGASSSTTQLTYDGDFSASKMRSASSRGS